jgi:DNA-binding IclR family transcriptional regulator
MCRPRPVWVSADGCAPRRERSRRVVKDGAVPDASRSVLRRALGVLDTFDYRDRDVSLSQLTKRTGLPKPTVLRIVRELVNWGALERGETGGYQLGVRLFVLGQKVPREGNLRDLAMPFLEDLYEATHENVNLGVLYDDTRVLYLARITGHRSSDVVLRVGDTLPAHSTSIGKALLAYAPPGVLDGVLRAGLTRLTPHTVVMPGMLRKQLRTVAMRGYAVNMEETHPGVVSVAAPVMGTDGTALAAISITGKAGRVDPLRLAPAVCTAARVLSRTLAATPYVQI